jgi:hypothetical protein
MIILTTRWFKYDRDYLCVNKSQFVPVIFQPPCIIPLIPEPNFISVQTIKLVITRVSYVTSSLSLFSRCPPERMDDGTYLPNYTVSHGGRPPLVFLLGWQTACHTLIEDLLAEVVLARVGLLRLRKNENERREWMESSGRHSLHPSRWGGGRRRGDRTSLC